MRATTRSLRLGLAGAALLAATLVAGPAGAASPSQNGTAGAAGLQARADDTTIGPRVERACLRIPNLDIRTANLKERLDGDATVRGSLAWLSSKVDAARAAERDQLTIVLENRLDVRTKTREVLDVRTDDLTHLRTRCEELGVDL